MAYVVTWDNGSGYREWCSAAQPTPEAAWKAAGIEPGEFPEENIAASQGGWCPNYKVEKVETVEFGDSNDRPCTCGSGFNWVNCPEGSQYCG